MSPLVSANSRLTYIHLGVEWAQAAFDDGRGDAAMASEREEEEEDENDDHKDVNAAVDNR
jgi:hypothetical protein